MKLLDEKQIDIAARKLVELRGQDKPKTAPMTFALAKQEVHEFQQILAAVVYATEQP